MSGARLRVAVLGAGTVGHEVACALLERAADPRSGDGPALELTAIAVRDVARAADRGLPAELLTDAPAHVVADDRADIIVELMGGDEPAHTLIAAALSMGKSVVTANKHVIAHHGAELEAIARRTGASLRFEASVGGGIPVLGPLASELAANRIGRVRGIVNGTTNYILSSMTDEAAPLDYATALATAQRLGYAEADPSGDVEGLDAANKLVILARLAFGRWLEPGAISTRPDGRDGPGGPGITTVSLDDQRDARNAGRIIRLVATASLEAGQRDVAATVLPTAVPLESPLGRTTGVQNRIEIDGTPVGRVGFDGPGAGGAATASAVLGDLLAVAHGPGSTWGSLPPPDAPSRGPVARPERAHLEAASGIRYPIDD